MRKILRKIFDTDFFGNVLSARMEQLTDDETGTIEESYVTTVSRCHACSRPLEKTNEARGHCIICGNSCCSVCEGYCTICRRGPICGRCRTGFPEKGLSVCSNCLPALKERLAYQDRLLEEKENFERKMALYNAEMKFIQLLQDNEGKISKFFTRVAQIRVAHKIAKLERQLKQRENNHDKRLLS